MWSQERNKEEARHRARLEQRRLEYKGHIAGISRKLDDHYSGQRDLSAKQLHKLEWNLAVLKFRHEYGHQTREGFELPDQLQATDPQRPSDWLIMQIGHATLDNYYSWMRSSSFPNLL